MDQEFMIAKILKKIVLYNTPIKWKNPEYQISKKKKPCGISLCRWTRSTSHHCYTIFSFLLSKEKWVQIIKTYYEEDLQLVYQGRERNFYRVELIIRGKNGFWFL